MALRDYTQLVVWQKGMDLVELVYRCTEGFPRKEIFGLASQLRRAAVAIPSNIAEGQGRQTTRDFLNFLSIARGSLQEVETQVLIAGRLNYLSDQQNLELATLSAEVGRLLNGLSKSLTTSH